MNQKLALTYKIFLEAEDITQSRINSTVSFVTNLFKNCRNKYFNHVDIENESDMEDFALRLYVNHSIEEDSCTSKEDAKTFTYDMMEFLDNIAAAHSYLDMEGEFMMEYEEEKKVYSFKSASGQDYCDIEEK